MFFLCLQNDRWISEDSPYFRFTGGDPYSSVAAVKAGTADEQSQAVLPTSPSPPPIPDAGLSSDGNQEDTTSPPSSSTTNGSSKAHTSSLPSTVS